MMPTPPPKLTKLLNRAAEWQNESSVGCVAFLFRLYLVFVI